METFLTLEARHLQPGDRVRRQFLDTPVTLRVVEVVRMAHIGGLVRVVMTNSGGVLLTSYRPDSKVTVVRSVTLAA